MSSLRRRSCCRTTLNACCWTLVFLASEAGLLPSLRSHERWRRAGAHWPTGRSASRGRKPVSQRAASVRDALEQIGAKQRWDKSNLRDETPRGRDSGKLAVAERERVLAENAEEIPKIGKRVGGDGSPAHRDEETLRPRQLAAVAAARVRVDQRVRFKVMRRFADR